MSDSEAQSPLPAAPGNPAIGMPSPEPAKLPRPLIAIVIPALNEEAVIVQTLNRIPDGLFGAVIVADNGSTDATARLAREWGATVISEPRRGYGSACLRALGSVPATSIVVFMQADGSEEPSQATRLLAPILDGRADLVIGSRILGKSAAGALLPHQRFGNWLAVTLIRWIFRHTYTDLGPFRAVRMEALRRLELQDRTYGWTVEMQVKAIQHGLRIAEVPVDYAQRTAGINKVSGNLRASVLAGAKIISTILKLSLHSSRPGLNS